MKAVLGLLLLVVIAKISVDAGPLDQSLTIGKLGPEDKLLNNETLLRTPKKNDVQRAFYFFNLKEQPGFISCIKIIDKWQNGTNAALTNYIDGVGTKEVTLTFRSKENSGLQYEIETWGS